MKTRIKKERHQTAARPASRSLPGARTGAESELQRGIDASAAMQRQRDQISSLGQPVQRAVDEEEPLQGKLSAQLQPEEEELTQGRFEGPLQRQGLEEEEPLQGKSDQPLQREQVQDSPNRTGLPDNLKHGLESLSGFDMSDLRVHYNSPEPAQLNAHAYARGSDIHLGPGQEKHLPHEAWHTVQQRQGRVQPTLESGGEKINDDAGLEREADVMGDEAIRHGEDG